MLVQDADLVDAAHNAVHLRDGCPGKLVVRIERFEPALNVERFDVLRDFVAPAGDEVVADDVLGNGCGVVRFRAHSILTEIGLEIVLTKSMEPDGAGAGSLVDSDS